MEERRGGAAVAAFDFFRFGDRRAEADGEVIGEVVATDGDCAGVAHNAAAVDNEFRCATADIEKAAAQVALVLRQA